MTSPTLDQEASSHPGPPPAEGGRRITEFTPEDAAAVAVMFNTSEEGWPGGFMRGVVMTAERVLRRQRETQPLATFISWEGDDAAGYCSLYDYPGERGVAGYVGLLNAATRFHGRGHGRELLKAALRRTIELGYRRLDLHTWPGNMKAVPLYKRSGYFWVPESEVHMENYLPLLLGMPALASFWQEADWYTTMVRPIEVKEDLILHGKMRVYPYEFRHGDRFVKATIDAAARGLTALETESWRVSCTIDDRRLIVGRPRTVRWEVENRSGRPLSLTLIAGAGKGLVLNKEASVVVQERYITEAILTAEPSYQVPAFGQSVPRVESLLLLDGSPIRLETGVEIKQPLTVRFDPRRISLTPGQPHNAELLVVNNMDEAAVGRFVLAPSPALQASVPDGSEVSGLPLTLNLTAQAESYAGTSLQVTASEAGVHELEVRGTVAIGDATIPLVPVHLALPAPAAGAIVALEVETVSGHGDGDVRGSEVRLEGETHRLVVDLREGGLHLEDSRTAATLAWLRVLAGPPFSWSAQSHVAHEATIEQRDGMTAVVLRGPVPHLPDAVVEHVLSLAPDGLVRVQTALLNLASDSQEMQGAVWLGTDRGVLPTVVMPTVHGVVAASDSEFPDWDDLDLSDASTYTEGWIACQGSGQVVGIIWSDVARVEAGGWQVARITQGAETLAPGERRVLPPIYVYTGPGDWRAVRARWRGLVAPNAPAHDPVTRDVVELTGQAAPAALLTGSNTLQLSSLASRMAAGQLTFEVPAGWELSPAVHEVSDLRVGQPTRVDVEVRHGAGGPRAGQVKGRLHTERVEMVIWDGAVLDLGRSDRPVTVAEGTEAGQQVLTVDNGYLRFQVAPGFVGSMVSLQTTADGVDHLLSAFPTAREFGWMRPWFGGLHPLVYAPGENDFPFPGRLYEETFTAQETALAGHDGRTWQGVRVHSALRGKALRGLELSGTYLTLPGSNLLAVRVGVRNTTSASLEVATGAIAYVQPGGTVDGAELLIDAEGRRRLLRAQRTEGVGGDRWIAVRNPRAGTTAALVCGTSALKVRVGGMDWGHLGAHAGASFTLRLAPGEEQSALAYLVLARDEEEARAYRALSSMPDLL